MTAPTTTPLSDAERHLLNLWKEVEASVETASAFTLDAVKAYSRAYSHYRLAKVASDLWQANQFSPAREILKVVEGDGS